MHYLIYKITNNLNGKFYIGKHKTENLDDGYMGSGLNIRRAIRKYGVENFTKEILFDVEDEELMNFVEELIVDEEFVKREDTYNIGVGGQGGALHTVPFSDEAKEKISKANKGKSRPFTEEHRQHLAEVNRRKPPMQGHHHSEDAKKKMSESHKGKSIHSEESKRKISEARKRYWERVHNQNDLTTKMKVG